MHFLRKITPLAVLIFLLPGFFSVAHAADYTSNLILHYSLDDNAANTTVTDSVGTSNATASVNTSALHAAGIIGSGSFAFASTSNQYADTSYIWSASDSNFTLSAWVNMDQVTNNENILGSYNGQNAIISMAVSFQGYFGCSVRDSVGNSTGTTLLQKVPHDGAWHFVVCVLNGTSLTAYLDNASVGSGSNASLNGNYRGNVPRTLVIGQQGNGSSWFGGSIDDVCIYNRALSTADLTALYASTSGCSPPPPSGPPAGSWYSTSASFFVHALPLSTGGGDSAYSYSTSTSFKIAGAASEAAVGTSSSVSFQVQSGYMRNLFKGPAPNYSLIHYHWRNDDGSETAATSMTGGVEDTAISSVSKLSTDRLRLEIANKGGTVANYSAQQFQLEYGLKSSTCAAISSWTSVVPSGDWSMVDSSNLTDGADTTNISTSVGGVSDENHTFISPNAGVKDTSSLTSSLSVPSDSFAELEYSIEPSASATDGGTYCFRVTNAGSATDFTYSQYPQATLSGGGGSLTFVTDSGSEAFPSVTPGTLSATTTILSVSTTNSSGFTISLQRGDPTGTMSLGSTYIPDKTDWMAPGATTTAGNATASTTQPQTLQFRVRKYGTDTANYASSWWGTDDTTPNALFGGISSTTQTIVNRSTSAVSTTTAYVQYDLDVPLSQKNGTYSGSITYIVTANP